MIREDNEKKVMSRVSSHARNICVHMGRKGTGGEKEMQKDNRAYDQRAKIIMYDNETQYFR